MAQQRYEFANSISFTTRKWLNRIAYHGGRGGWLFARVQVKRGKPCWNGDTSLRIGDCGQDVSLDIEAESPRERDAAVRKCDTLIREITRVRTALGKIEYLPVRETDCDE